MTDDDDEPHLLALRSTAARDAAQALCYGTMTATVPAPVVYDMLGNLKGAGGLLAQTFTQLGPALARSLDDYDVVEDDGGNPTTSVAAAVDHLLRAAALAQAMEDALDAAQSAIAGQGYRPAAG